MVGKMVSNAFVRHGNAWIAGALWMAAASSHAQAPATLGASRVAIESTWGGLSPDAPLRTHIVLERDGSAYRLTGGRSQGRGASRNEQAFSPQEIPAENVERLLDAMRAPAQAQIELDTLQPTIRSAQGRIDWMLREASLPSSPPPLAGKIRAWRDGLRNPQVLTKVLTKGFGATHTDDYPIIQVEVTLSNGSTLSARSGSQQFLMLPWINAQGSPTYSPALPRALDALLPVESTNKERLEAGLDESQLDELLSFGLHSEKDRFDVEAQAPEALRLLDARFKVLEVSLVTWEGRHISADLQLAGGPPNLVLATRLALNGPSLAHPGDIDRIAQQLALAQSSPAMAARMQATPRSDFIIQDQFGWTWLNEKTATQFVQQMQAMKKLPELATNPSLMRGAVMIMEGRLPVYWIVLSDRRAVRWKKYSPQSGPPGSVPCEATPIASDEPSQDTTLDACIGEVYGIDGRMH